MPRTGTLRTWHEDRGFGFIAPTDGGREIFVHVSAFPRDGSRPTVGESLTYDVGPGKDGKAQALHVQRRALAGAAGAAGAAQRVGPAARPSRVARRGSRPLITALVVVGLVATGVFGYARLQRPAPAADLVPLSAADAVASPAAAFRCDGRTHCSQMTSCAEAKFFLAHCPGTQMDGNRDGVPCEQQWCTSPFSK